MNFSTFVLFTLIPATQDLLVVDDTQAPGTDFTTVQGQVGVSV